jgi:hypothetical protein
MKQHVEWFWAFAAVGAIALGVFCFYFLLGYGLAWHGYADVMI